MKNPLIPAGIEPATFRFVARHPTTVLPRSPILSGQGVEIHKTKKCLRFSKPHIQLPLNIRIETPHKYQHQYLLCSTLIFQCHQHYCPPMQYIPIIPHSFSFSRYPKEDIKGLSDAIQKFKQNGQNYHKMQNTRDSLSPYSKPPKKKGVR